MGLESLNFYQFPSLIRSLPGACDFFFFKCVVYLFIIIIIIDCTIFILCHASVTQFLLCVPQLLNDKWHDYLPYAFLMFKLDLKFRLVTDCS